MKTIILFHANCTDGAGSAWSAWKHFGDKAEYIPVGKQSKNQSTMLNKCKKADIVFMCDMMLHPDQIREFLQAGTKVHVLDHHLSNIERLDEVKEEFTRDYPETFRDFCDIERSGAGITWDHFHGGSRPVIIDYIEDFDLWHWKLPDGPSIHTYLSQFNWNKIDGIIKQFTKFEKMTPGHFAAAGTPLVEYRESLIQRNMSQVGRAEILGFNVPILNSNHFISETGNIMCEGEPFALIWQLTKNGLVRASLRSSDGGENVMRIAQQLGYDGGGHVRAAGTAFKSLDAMLKEIKFL